MNALDEYDTNPDDALTKKHSGISIPLNIHVEKSIFEKCPSPLDVAIDNFHDDTGNRYKNMLGHLKWRTFKFGLVIGGIAGAWAMLVLVLLDNAIFG